MTLAIQEVEVPYNNSDYTITDTSALGNKTKSSCSRSPHAPPKCCSLVWNRKHCWWWKDKSRWLYAQRKRRKVHLLTRPHLGKDSFISSSPLSPKLGFACTSPKISPLQVTNHQHLALFTTDFSARLSELFLLLLTPTTSQKNLLLRSDSNKDSPGFCPRNKASTELASLQSHLLSRA